MNGQKVVLVILVLLGLLLMTPGICVIHFFGKPILDRAKESEHWPVADGEILTSEVVREQSENSELFSTNILYRYTVNEQEMESDQVWIGGSYSSSNRKEFQRIVNDFPAGKEVKVYYNPDDPVDSVLLPGAFTSSYIVYVIGWAMVGMDVLFFGFVITLVYWFMKSGKSKGNIQQESYPVPEADKHI